jgi:putative tryptophan/tyrosine transport system substrate-binding protein
MNRRAFIAGLGSAAAWPLVARGQQSMQEVGLLYPGPADAAAARAKIVWQGLNDTGYVEGKNLTLVSRATNFNPDLTEKFSIEFAQRNLRAILAVGPTEVRATQAATKTTPIVALDLETDPVSTGLMASLARPGGNLTGLFFDFPDFSSKWLQLLQEAIPGLSRVAVVWDPTTGPVQVKAAEAAAATQGLHLQIIEVREPPGLESAVAAAERERAQGVVVLSSPLFSTVIGAPKVAELAAVHRLPAVSLFPEFAQFGGLMGYGPKIADIFRQAGALVGRVLHGEKPADLPVERPTRLYLVINLKTAKSLGLEIPPTLLARADEVIE